MVMCTDRERVGCMGWSRDEAETREEADGMEEGKLCERRFYMVILRARVEELEGAVDLLAC